MNYLKPINIFILLLISNSCISQSNVNIQPLLPEVRENYIQKATLLRKEENYFGAIQQLDSILDKNPLDAAILLFKGDLQLQSKLYKKAVTTYLLLLPLNYEKIIVQINLSYALFMNHKPAKALLHARNAWQQNKTNAGAIVNYFNAQLWNLKTKDAKIFLNEQQKLLNQAQMLVLKARLYTTEGNFTKGLKFYDSLVASYTDKYYTQEYSEVLLGKKEFKKSAETMMASKDLFSESEYNIYNNKLKATKVQNAGTEFVYFKDVAKNVRVENILWWQQNEAKVYRFRLSAGTSKITSVQNEKTTAQFAHVTISERWNKSWSGQSDLHLQLIQPNNSESFTGLTGKQTVQYQPNDRRMVGLSYSADILNFTASLLQKNIRSNSIGYVTHLLMTGKSGFYSQGSKSFLSDKNQSQQFFGSLYHLFRTEPTLKAGLNFSAVHYKDSSIKTYFSPNRYLSSEIFADYSTALPMFSIFYLQLQAAGGVQKIEQQKWDPAFRFQSELGFRLKQFETSIKYQTSNVASATGTGYKFNWFTFKLMWKW